MREVTLVCGPPCAGKTHYVRTHATDEDVVLDFDDIAVELGSPNPHDHPRSIRSQAEKIMRREMRRVCYMPDGRAWVIRTCIGGPLHRAREALAIRATDVVVLNPDRETLRARAAERTPDTWAVIERWLAAERHRQRWDL